MQINTHANADDDDYGENHKRCFQLLWFGIRFQALKHFISKLQTFWQTKKLNLIFLYDQKKRKPVVVDQNEVVVEACTNNDEIILETIEPVKEPSPPPVQPIPKPKTTTIAAPQLKFAEDGSIILNEESLVIQREHHEPVYESTIVESEQNDNLTYNSYQGSYNR